MDDAPEKLAEKQPVSNGSSPELVKLIRKVELEMQALVGTTIGGHYEILSLIQTGGMSAVFKARHIVLNKIMAVKVILPDTVGDTTGIMRFKQEAKAAIGLNDPNIVKVTEFGVDAGGRPFLVMEWIDGPSLADELKAGRAFSSERAVKIVAQVCGALEHAHANGLVHRDIKPGNIMLAKDAAGEEVVKVVDFGIAKLLDEDNAQRLTQTGDMLGSPLYMSPEQCLGMPTDARSDIYSLGCVLYELLSGAPPLRGENTLQTIHKHINEAAPPIKGHGAGVNGVVQRALRKNADERFGSAGEFRQALLNPGAAFAGVGGGGGVVGRGTAKNSGGLSRVKLLVIGAIGLVMMAMVALFAVGSVVLFPENPFVRQSNISWTWHYLKPESLVVKPEIPYAAADSIRQLAKAPAKKRKSLPDKLRELGWGLHTLEDVQYKRNETSEYYDFMKKTRETLQSLPTSATTNPNVSGDIHALISMCAYGMRDFRGARVECIEALRDWDNASGMTSQPEYFDTVVRLADCDYLERNWGNAESEYLRAVALADKYIQKDDLRRGYLLSRLGDCYRYQRDLENAQNYYNRAEPFWLSAGKRGEQDEAMLLLQLNHLGAVRGFWPGMHEDARKYVGDAQIYERLKPAIDKAFKQSKYSRFTERQYAQIMHESAQMGQAMSIRWNNFWDAKAKLDGLEGLPIEQNETTKPLNAL